VAEAARDDAQGRFKRGEAVGFVDEEMLAWGEPGETLQAVIAALADSTNGSVEASEVAGDGRVVAPELISILAGEEAPLELDEVERVVNGGGVELELRHGGQPAYWWLLVAE